jgi:acid phosphatase type 7
MMKRWMLDRARALAIGLVLGAALAAPGVSSLAAQEPAAVFLTWSDDPTTTVTVDWHLLPGDDLEAVEVRGPGIATWRAVSGETVPFPYSQRTVRRAVVRGLQPDALYELRVGSDGPVYQYRSLPSRLTRPVRFATGGDTQYSMEAFGTTNRVVAAHDLDFVVFGGDLSYANGDPRNAHRKEGWFETVTRTLITPENRLIPVLVAIGNHEVWESRRLDADVDVEGFKAEWGLAERQATYFEPLFAFPRARFHDVLDFGDYLSIVALDSDHMTDVIGAQTDWLRETLATRADRAHVFPVYHQPAYPSVRRFDGTTSTRIRENWVPLFERHGVRLVFENHDHAYKRTVPLRGGAAATDGVVYLGDGAWGVGTREIGRDQGGPAWYLASSASVNHGIVVTLDGPAAHVRVVDREGRTIDEYLASAGDAVR